MSFKAVLLRPLAAIVTLALAMALLVVAPPDRAAADGSLLPFTVTNSSGLGGPSYVYVMARDQASGLQGWVDGQGTWHQFDLPASIGEGVAPPAAPDTSIAGPVSGATSTIYLRPGLVAGRIYISFATKLQFFLTPNGLVEPAGWVPTDPNHGTLYDWVEFARDGSRIFINTTMVDMFSVPISVHVVKSNGSTETQGQLVGGGRSKIFSEIAASGWSGLVQTNPEGTLPLRVIAPIHGVEQGALSGTYFAGYVSAVWSYYATHTLTVNTALGPFSGKVSGSDFVFKDSNGATAGTFSQPSTQDIFACKGAVQPSGQPNETAALAIGARLCAGFNRGTLSTAAHAGSDTQATHDASGFYPAGVSSNLYSKAMHDGEANGNAYGFAFDDVAEFSPSIDADSPQTAGMTVAPFNGASSGKPLTASVSSLFGTAGLGGYSDDPVNVATGNFSQSESIIGFPARWAPNLGGTYNSRDTHAGELGLGWSSPLSEHITTSSGHAVVTWVDGSTADYTQDGAAWTAPGGVNAALTQTSNGWTVSRPDGTTDLFDSGGRVSELDDGLGRSVTLTRDGSGNVSALTGSDGYTLTLNWAAGRVTSVASSDGRTATLTYTGTQLTGITDPAGHSTTFGYSGGSGYLTTITDADSVPVVTNTYDSAGRVTRQVRPGVPAQNFVYDPNAGTTQIKDDDGTLKVTYTLDEHGQLLGTLAADGTTSSQTYTDTGWPATSTDRTGTTSTTSYSTSGQITGMQAGAASTQFAYDSQGRLTTAKDQNGKATTYTYGSGSRLPTGVQLPDGTTVGYSFSGPLLASSTDGAGKASTYTYDPHGNLATATTPTGKTTTTTYDDAGRPVTRTAPDGGNTTYAYDDAGHLTTVTGPTGGVTTTTYTDAGRIATVTDPDGRKVTYGYDSAGQLASVTGPGTTSAVYHYDSQGQIDKVTDGAGVATTYAYDAYGRVTRSTTGGTTTRYAYDANGRVTSRSSDVTSATYQYDDLGRVVSVTDGQGHRTQLGYDTAGNLNQVVDPTGATSSTIFDDAGRTLSSKDPLGRTTSYAYDSAGRRTSATDPMGYVTGYGYDDDGNLTSLTTPARHTWAYGYDGVGRLTSSTSPTGLTTTTTYDRTGAATATAQPGAGTRGTGYSAAGLVTSTGDGDGSATFTYNASGQLATAKDATGAVTTYGYDGAGHLTSLKDPRGATTTYTYSAAGDLHTTVDALNRVTTYDHDVDHRVTKVTDPDGHTTSYTYDGAGNLTARTDPDGSPVAWTYDATGRRTSMHDATGTTTYVYDAAGQLTDLTTGTGGHFTFTYDGDGRTATTTYPDGTLVSYGHDPDGNLVAVSDNHGHSVTYALDDDGRVTHEHTSNGTDRAFTYLGSLLAAYTQQAPSATPVTTTLTRDNAGRITKSSTAGTDTTYTYDGAGQLLSATGTDGSHATYTYDADGNRHTASDGTHLDTYSYDAANQLSGIDRDGHSYATFTYDTSGRLTNQTVGDQHITLAHNGSGQPLGLTRAGPTGIQQATLTRNGDGAPVTLATTTTPAGGSATTATTTLGWLPASTGIDQLATWQSSSTAIGTQDLLYGNASRTPALAVNATSATDINRDALGSVLGAGTGLTATSATSYDAFGAPSASSSLASIPVTLGYRGALQVAGLDLLGARALDPATSRFTAVDPLAGVPGQAAATSLYGYVNNDPLDLIDPLGLRALADSTFQCGGWGCFGKVLGNFGAGFASGFVNGLGQTVSLGLWNPGLDWCPYGTGGVGGAACTAGNITGQVGAFVAVSLVPGVGEAAVSARATEAGVIASRAAETAQAEAEAYAAALRAAEGRTPTAASAAVDARTGNVYLGHSGGAAEVPPALRSQLPDPSLEPWSATNCAEVAACSRALQGGASLDDLAVWTVRTRTGEYFPPCANCSTWLPGSKP